MDCRGPGVSEHTANGYNIPQYALDVIGLADALGLARFTYVGHSMAGGIGYYLGTHHAERLNKLVLVAPISAAGPKGDPKFHEDQKLLRSSPAGRATMIKNRLLARVRTSEALVIQGIDRALSVSEGHFDDSWESMVDFDVSDKLSEMTTPTLMIAGAADSLCAANVMDWQSLPNATLHVFSRVGHGVPRDVPNEFADVVRDFMVNGVVNAATLQRWLATEERDTP